MSSLNELRELQEAAFEAPIDEGEFEYCVLLDDATRIVTALAAERDRMKAALEDIAYWEGGPKPPHNRHDFDDAHFDCTAKEGCPAMVARAALAPGTPVDVE